MCAWNNCEACSRLRTTARTRAVRTSFGRNDRERKDGLRGPKYATPRYHFPCPLALPRPPCRVLRFQLMHVPLALPRPPYHVLRFHLMHVPAERCAHFV
eukprot:2502717-Prymnesium_polylepis.1